MTASPPRDIAATASDATDDLVLVIGAGPAGLAAAREISHHGVRVQILERSDRVGASWAARYASLRLNSGRIVSSLPGMRMERRLGRWVKRNDFLDYLERYARRAALTIEFGVTVDRVERSDGRWLVHTGDRIRTASAVVVATGLNSTPAIPRWAEHDFPGDLTHSDRYRDSAPYLGRDVLVVGSGSSAHDIALDLVRGGAGRVRMSVRTAPLLAPKQLLGISTSIMSILIKHGPRVSDRVIDTLSLWLHRACFPDANELLGAPAAGLATALRDRGHGLTVEVGLLEAIRRGEIEMVAPVDGINDGTVVLGDGRRIRPDAVILATGYRTGLNDLVEGLDVLGADGRPRVHAPHSLPPAPNLYFLGYRVPAGQLPDLSIDSRRLARTIRRHARRLRADERSFSGATATSSADDWSRPVAGQGRVSASSAA